MTRILQKYFPTILSVAFWLVVWELIALFVSNPLIFVGPIDTARALIQELGSAVFWASVGATLLEVCSSFLLAFFLGVSVSLLASSVAVIKALLDPLVAFFKSVPVACITVILLLWTGPFFLVFFVVFLLVFPAFYGASKEAYRSFLSEEKNGLSTLGLSTKQLLYAYFLPRLVESIKEISKSVVGMSWKAAIAAQVIGLVGIGLGDGVYRAKVLLDVPSLFALTFVVVLLSVGCEVGFLKSIERVPSLLSKRALAAVDKKEHIEPAAITAQNISLSYENKELFSHVSFTVFPGKYLFFVGNVGSGKTSLATLLLKNNQATLAMLGQVTVFPPYLSPYEAFSLLTNADEAQELTEFLYGNTDVSKPAAYLSGGQRRLLALGMVLLSQSTGLILDEPFGGMDTESRARAKKAILRYAHRRPVIITAHDTTDVSDFKAEVFTLE